MFRSMQKIWTVCLHAVIVTAAVAAIFATALTMPPEIDHHILSTQPNVVSATDADLAGNDAARSAPDTECHIGPGCIFAIIPDTDVAVARLGGAPEFSRAARFRSSGPIDPLFHPPRILSHV